MHGVTKRDGIRIAYQVTGDGERTIVLLPAWMITNRRMWAAQVEALSARFRTVTFDARGSGESDRPLEPAAYEPAELVRDLTAVLDATGTGRALLVGNSFGGLLGCLAAAGQPDRVAGLVLIGPTVDVLGAAPSPLQQAMVRFDDELGNDEGWARYNRRSWDRDYPGFVAWFVETALGADATPEMLAEGIAWGLDNTPEVLAATVAARSGAAQMRRVAEAIRCPSLVLTGAEDAICPPHRSRALAEVLGARYLEVPGGHCPHVTRPAGTAELISAFAAEVWR
ncbi:alpha/beta hydrolase [Actinoplanes sp. NPDC024001]|uniref:alpha/beta fold hydrolase n=1 Tax=Actinoplanes sp. NPDC024001 TaxID=3154598 RepID=UPI0034002A84